MVDSCAALPTIPFAGGPVAPLVTSGTRAERKKNEGYSLLLIFRTLTGSEPSNASRFVGQSELGVGFTVPGSKKVDKRLDFPDLLRAVSLLGTRADFELALAYLPASSSEAATDDEGEGMDEADVAGGAGSKRTDLVDLKKGSSNRRAEVWTMLWQLVAPSGDRAQLVAGLADLLAQDEGLIHQIIHHRYSEDLRSHLHATWSIRNQEGMAIFCGEMKRYVTAREYKRLRTLAAALEILSLIHI